MTVSSFRQVRPKCRQNSSINSKKGEYSSFLSKTVFGISPNTKTERSMPMSFPVFNLSPLSSEKTDNSFTSLFCRQYNNCYRTNRPPIDRIELMGAENTTERSHKNKKHQYPDLGSHPAPVITVAPKTAGE